MKRLKLSVLAIALFCFTHALGQEKIFADYFDIEVNSPKGTEVTGRIHLERNKDVLTKPVPRSYKFSIVSQTGDLFDLETRFDPLGRIMGVFVARNILSKDKMGRQRLTITLKDGTKTINTFAVEIGVVEKTLWETLYERYKGYTVSNKGGRMYGRKSFSDAKVTGLIAELEANKGRFKEFGFYGVSPVVYKSQGGKKLESEWEKAAASIGGLGYAYAKSKKYGPAGNPQDREKLKKALYEAIIAYTESVPVEGNDVMINGKPIGNCTGDGFANLRDHKLIGNQIVTHQWGISDALIAPGVQLIPEIVNDIKKGDKQAERVYYDLVRFFQTIMAESTNRRAIDDPKERWGELQDTLRSSGARADANLGHRSRALLAMPIIWADYNRPLTYVQYWYTDYYQDKPFKNFSFSYGWSPHGVISDVARWLTKYNVPAHQYAQSGFQPDGTVSHHVGEATDAAMVAYGFEWLTDAFAGFNQYKNTDFKLADKYYQFPADRLEKVYPKMFYKGRMDFLVGGRSYLNDLQKFVSKTYLSAIKDLKESKSAATKLTNEAKLDTLYHKIENNTFEYSGTDAYWVNEFLVHRRGESEKPFYASVKLKSKRTVGAEDFDPVRKSWHAAYGIMPLKVRGDEYSEKVLGNMDWHVLPGLTEEWRTDPLPAEGGSQASLPGNNDIAGVTADGKSGVAIYHHLPAETYSSVTAFKSYYFIEDKIIALGNNIKRLRPGQQKDIVTTVDQSSFVKPLTIFHDGKIEVIAPSQSVNLSFEITAPMWLHTGEKGYVIYPEGKQHLLIKTGKEINTTDRSLADNTPNFIISINHGINPDANAGYFYSLVPNVTDKEMPGVLEKYQKEIVYKKDVGAQGVFAEKTWEMAFFKPASLTIGSLTVKTDDPALFICKDNGDNWKLTMSNPAPAIDKQQLVFHISQPLKPGKYNYRLGGIYPRDGEYVTVAPEGTGSKIVVELADKRDEAYYNYQTVLYNAAPITIEVEKVK